MLLPLTRTITSKIKTGTTRNCVHAMLAVTIGYGIRHTTANTIAINAFKIALLTGDLSIARHVKA